MYIFYEYINYPTRANSSSKTRGQGRTRPYLKLPNRSYNRGCSRACKMCRRRRGQPDLPPHRDAGGHGHPKRQQQQHTIGEASGWPSTAKSSEGSGGGRGRMSRRRGGRREAVRGARAGSGRRRPSQPRARVCRAGARTWTKRGATVGVRKRRGGRSHDGVRRRRKRLVTAKTPAGGAAAAPHLQEGNRASMWDENERERRAELDSYVYVCDSIACVCLCY
jgi:hypothetical protein